MVDTGWLSPSGCSGYFVDPTNVYISDNARAAADDAATPEQYYNFNFNIPARATIDGIEVSMEGYKESGESSSKLQVRLSGNGGGDWTLVKTTSVFPYGSENEAYLSVGDSADTWGRTWSIDEFSNANFRVYLNCIDTGVGDLFIDHVRIKVYYSLTGPLPTHFRI